MQWAASLVRHLPAARYRVIDLLCRRPPALPYAAAASDGSLCFELCEQSGSNFGLSRVATDRGAGANQIKVPARTLDAMLEEWDLGTVHLLKMDIEGAQGFALAGLQRSLSAHRILRVLLGLHPTALKEYGYRVEEVFEHLASAGYRGQVIDHSRVVTRRTAYGKTRHVNELLRSIVPNETLDPWPHLLWTCD